MRQLTAWSALALAVCGVGFAGTVSLLKDLDDSEVIGSSSPWYLGTSGTQAIFAASQPGVLGSRLYRSDGTSAGTVPVNVTGLVEPRAPLQFGTRVLLLGSNDASQVENRLWVTDGTDAGTQVLFDLATQGRQMFWLKAAADRAFFAAAQDLFTSADLYVTDGTAAGTRRLTTNQRVIGGSYLAPTGELYFFSAAVDGSAYGLWTSDGTVAGTRSLYSFATLGLEAVGPVAWGEGRHIFVNADDTSHQRGLFNVDLDTGAVQQIASNGFNGFAENAVLMGGARYFLMDSRLWRSDGTPAGTTVLTIASQPNTLRAPLVVLGNRLAFVKGDAATGDELWTSDGTVGGTGLVTEIAPGYQGSARILAATASRVFLLATDVAGRARFWVSDGTAANTRVIPLQGGGSYSVEHSDYGTSAVLGNRLLLTASDIEQGPNSFNFITTLWSTDFTGSDITRVGPGGSQLMSNGERVFFANVFDDVGNEPWISDGTAAGTARLRDLAVTGQTAHSNPLHFTASGGRGFFVASDPVHGRELWVTDGTGAGTRMVRDINPGLANGGGEGLRDVDGTLYFMANDGPIGSTPSLWRSDGTEGGTIKLGAEVRYAPCGPWIVKYNGRVWFFAEGASDGAELWSTDGTVAGTRSEFPLPDEIKYQLFCGLTATSNAIVFEFLDQYSNELWRTDGTPTGTYRLGDIIPGAAATPDDDWIVGADGVAYVIAIEDQVSGRELWRTDGTAAGTTLVADLTPGVEGAQSFTMARFGNGVLFTYMSAIGSADGLYRVAGPNAAPEFLKAGNVATSVPYPAGSKAFFHFNDANTESLWVTDGSVAGTRFVLDNGAGSTLPINDRVAGDGRLFFRGPFNGSEQLWFTTGETGGTHRLSNFTQSQRTFGYNMVLVGGRPLFAFDDLVHGVEPWIMTNLAPGVADDLATVARDSNVLINVRANDSDVDSDAAVLRLSTVTAPAHGTLTVEAGGLRYTPFAGYSGTDTFEYRLIDELDAQSAIARVTITVTAPPDPPRQSGGGGGALDPGWVALLALLLGLRCRAPRTRA